jgi:hypothetical protein
VRGLLESSQYSFKREGILLCFADEETEFRESKSFSPKPFNQCVTEPCLEVKTVLFRDHGMLLLQLEE